MARGLTTAEFIERARNKHGEAFDYSLVNYINAEVKIQIRCTKCNTVFKQTPHSHLRGSGCDQCVRLLSRMTNSEFINKAKLVHGNKYSYSRCRYTTSRSKVKIYCKKCKEFFNQTAGSHIRGVGCPKCNTLLGNTEDFIAKAKLKHGDKYDYGLTVYRTALDKVFIYCKTHKHYFSKIPNHHLRGQGCNDCSNSGFKPSLPTLLYYIKVEGKYKIGVTNRTIAERFSAKELARLTVIKVWEFKLGKDALDREREILHTFKKDRYLGKPLLLSGHTEFFNYDVLGEDNGS